MSHPMQAQVVTCVSDEIAPHSVSIHLLKWPKELKKSSTYQVTGFLYDMPQGRPCTRDAQGKAQGRRVGPPRSLWLCHSPHLQVSASLNSLPTPTFLVSLEVSLHRHDRLNHWPLNRHDDSTSRPWRGTESFNPLTRVGSPTSEPTSLGAFQKSPH